MLILIAMLAYALFLTYIVWFRWDWFVQFTIRINRDNPLFKYYEGFYTSGVGKWFLRILLLPIGLFLLFVLYGILGSLTTGA